VISEALNSSIRFERLHLKIDEFVKNPLSPSSVIEVNPTLHTHHPHRMDLEPGAIVIVPARVWRGSAV